VFLSPIRQSIDTEAEIAAKIALNKLEAAHKIAKASGVFENIKCAEMGSLVDRYALFMALVMVQS
jgi:hypothetical protein